jgi:hypothetical protein
VPAVRRPIRIGWCVRGGNLEDYKVAVLLTHTLWGGRFNPILPVDNAQLSDSLIELFQVDALFPVSDDPSVGGFLGGRPHLPWPLLQNGLFVKSGETSHSPLFLDISHPLFLLKELLESPLPPERLLPSVRGDDPLSNVLIATFGGYPNDDFGDEYRQGFRVLLNTSDFELDPDFEIPPILEEAITPNVVSGSRLLTSRPTTWTLPGMYVGDANSFTDLVSFWNLRAAGADLVFHDPLHRKRTQHLLDAHVKRVTSQFSSRDDWERRFSIWTDENGASDDAIPSVEAPTMRCIARPGIWNGMNIRAPDPWLSSEAATVTVTSDAESTSATIVASWIEGLRRGPRLGFQHAVLSLDTSQLRSTQSDQTFKAFNLPELNRYYGRSSYYDPNSCRPNRHGLSIIHPAADVSVTIRSHPIRELIQAVFALGRIKATSSHPGLVAAHLVRQMGGIQGCRVFKVAGVRRLIESVSATQSFTRSQALQMIGDIDPNTRQPRFSRYEDLHIARRNRSKLTPEDAFLYLLDKRVFRVGLELLCPNCRLTFWKVIDQVGTLTECEYCGEEFNIAMQLRDRDWRYRRSGLFGRDDHQHGAVPVVLALQQLDANLRYQGSVFSTGMELERDGAPPLKCETDLVWLGQEHSGRVHLAVGECKTQGEITSDDVQNLVAVIEALPRRRVSGFLVFAKTSDFTESEIERCRQGSTKHERRVVLLGPRELEPFYAYEESARTHNVDKFSGSLTVMAENTHRLYFDPQRKEVLEPPTE